LKLRDPDIERRLQNWSRWKAGEGSGGLGYASPLLGSSSGGGSSGYREAVIPTWDTEAAVTDQAVQALDEEMRKTIEAYYLTPGTAFAVAYELGIALRTLHNRVERAYYALQLWFNERERALAAERARVESLIKTRGGCQ
jgi:hypothetical protein